MPKCPKCGAETIQHKNITYCTMCNYDDQTEIVQKAVADLKKAVWESIPKDLRDGLMEKRANILRLLNREE